MEPAIGIISIYQILLTYMVENLAGLPNPRLLQILERKEEGA